MVRFTFTIYSYGNKLIINYVPLNIAHTMISSEAELPPGIISDDIFQQRLRLLTMFINKTAHLNSPTV